MSEWLWYAILGLNLGSIAASWVFLWHTYTRGKALVEHYYAYEQEQWARWQEAWRRLTRETGRCPDD